ncbi:hypothetical protein SAMN04488490_1043 [Marinobacter sp. LV10R510-11A]|uniref:DUF5676 family membrane protein n=1 Tax=Marinobacter sp. LV10R510-11A TaxID=1415568 RepID=UPI000BB6BAEE|nr:DUF5676 family membrane protein [Marinobacter sp. LV10R510-11A]SOB75449.1 hypothetical protein SAMN04488490_1043 [Marinobacter sp. LV10R510-11A]
MSDVETASSTKLKLRYGTPLPVQAVPRIPVIALGMSLGLFLAVTFILCVGFDLLFPDRAMYESWLRLLPGFTWLSWPSFFLGLAESFGYGWYVALIFGPLYNFFAARINQRR